MGTGAKVEKKVGVISGLGLKWGLLLFAGSLLNVLTLTPNPGNTIRASRLASATAMVAFNRQLVGWKRGSKSF